MEFQIDVSDIIALFSLLVSGIAIFKTWKIDKELKVYELKAYKEREIESKKALLDVKIFSGKSGLEVQIYNRGISTARNVRVLLDEDFEDSGILIFNNEELNPYPFLHNGDSFGLRLVLMEGHESLKHLKISWDDDFEMNREKEYLLSF